jgi:hypothetical protein
LLALKISVENYQLIVYNKYVDGRLWIIELSYIKIGFLYDIKSGDVHVVSFHIDIMTEDKYGKG